MKTCPRCSRQMLDLGPTARRVLRIAEASRAWACAACGHIYALTASSDAPPMTIDVVVEEI